MGYRVFATQELHPFTAGGIGRVIGNFLAEASQDEMQSTVVLLCSEDASLAGKVTSVYTGLKCIVVSERDFEADTADGRVYPSFDSYEYTHPLHRKSVVVMQALMRLERELGSIDYVEFPDWGGMAFASCQEKKLGRGLAGATLAVRLHTTDGLLASFEQRGVDDASLALFDLERKAIADCDLVVGQLKPVAEYVRRYYGFAREDWEPRLHIHAPAVRLDGDPAATTVRPSLETPITFTSKIQHCKRPDVFVRGCVEFLLAHPEVTAPVRFIAHAFDGAYYERVKSLIPAHLAGRFEFVSGLAGINRTAAIANTVCVFPTSYESFCLAAYEASLAGALPLVNGSTPAFADGTPWISGVNCIGFDGSVRGLSKALKHAFLGDIRAEPVRLPADDPSWSIEPKAGAPRAKEPVRARVAAVIAHRNDAHALLDTLDSLSALTNAIDEIVIVDGASDDAVSTTLLKQLDAVQRVRVCHSGVSAPTGSLLSRGLDEVSTDFVLLMEAGAVVSPDFVDDGARALMRNDAFDFSISPAMRRPSAALSPAEAVRAHVTMGEACAFAVRDRNHVPPPCLLARTRAVRDIGFGDELEIDPWWQFHLQAMSGGHRYLVSSTVDVEGVRYRHADSATPEQVQQHNVVRSLDVSVGSVRVPPYALCGTKARSEVNPAVNDELDAYRRMELVAAAVKITQFLQYRAPRLLRALTGALRRGWRVYKRLRGRS
ncbi:MAG TPA: glycosyltransferase [Lysobacter sp.]